MSLRNAEISQLLTRWLDRYSCPSHLREKPTAAQAEAEALAAVLTRFAPQSDYQPFVSRVFSTLDFQMKTRAWPTVAELGAICAAVRKDTAKAIGPDDAADMRPEAITARAMKAGRPVGESWLYGRQAVAMIAAGLIDRETMSRYRSGAFLARKAAYGEAEALAWEAEAKQRHEDAKVIHRQVPEAGRDVRVPTNQALDGFAA